MNRNKAVWASSIIVLLVLGIIWLMPKGEIINGSKIDNKRELEKLQSLPYLSFAQKKLSSELSDVVIYDPDIAYNGYNLYCSRTSSDAFLIDMRGQVVNQWSNPHVLKGIWDYAILLENGDLVVLNKFNELIRLDWDSQLIWQKKIAVHHDIAVAPDSTFYVIVREIKGHRGLRVRFPVIVHLDHNGGEIDRWSTYDQLNEINSFLIKNLSSIQNSIKEVGHIFLWPFTKI